MSHFYGVLKGSRGSTTRGGTITSGLTATAAGWEGAVEVEVFVKVFSDEGCQDWAKVWLTDWPSGRRIRVLWEGPLMANP